MRRWLLVLMLAAITCPALAQPVTSPTIRLRVATLIALLRDAKVDETAFAPSFLAQVPGMQVEQIARQLRETNGTVVGVASVTAESTTQALVSIDYADAAVTVRIALEAPEPHRFIGLLITDVSRRGDSVEALIGDIKKLSGTSALLIAKLGAQRPNPSAAYNAEIPVATGSMFNLFVFAELARETDAKERRWTDVVPLGPPSLPSGVTQNWPRRLPVTLATLATEMISISDNTATDTLIETLGRAKVDEMCANVGNTRGSLPMLSTLEAFSLKMPRNEALRNRWIAGGVAERRQVLHELQPTLTTIDYSALAGPPLHINTVEWPATMTEIVSVLDLLRRTRGQTAVDILGINTSLTIAERGRFDVIGYKGGSESGVIAMSWLLKTKSGQWFAVAAA